MILSARSAESVDIGNGREVKGGSGDVRLLPRWSSYSGIC